MSSSESDTELTDYSSDDPDFVDSEEEESSGDDENTPPRPVNVPTGIRTRTRTYMDPDDGPDDPLPAFLPERPPGLHLPDVMTRQDHKQFVTAASFFQLFFCAEIVGQICQYTNQSAAQLATAKPYLSKGWTDTTPEEIYKFIALLMYMSIVQVPRLELYWSTKQLFHGLWARSFMSKHRFKQIQAFLKISNPDTERPDDKLRKVRFVHDFLRMRCMKFWQPNECVSVDERMVQNKGRYGFRQYIKDKPTKWGMKLWILADSSTGYTYNFEVYTGKGDRSVFGLGYDVVMRLLRSLYGQGYKLFVDNFYSSVQLFLDLLGHKVLACGTILANRKGVPAEIRDPKTFKKQGERGNMRWVRKGNLGFVQWIDNKVVTFITTMHKSLCERLFCNRRTKVQGQFRNIQVSQPKVIKDYNQYMGGVDRSDQMIGKYKVLRRTAKYWKTLMYHFFDIARVNSFIMFQEYRRKHQDIPELSRPSDYSQLHFTLELIKELAQLSDDDKVPLYNIKNSVECHQVVPLFTDVRRNCSRCYRVEKKQLKCQVKCGTCDKYFCFNSSRNCLLADHPSVGT